MLNATSGLGEYYYLGSAPDPLIRSNGKLLSSNVVRIYFELGILRRLTRSGCEMMNIE